MAHVHKTEAVQEYHEEQMQHHSHTKLYVLIFFVLFAVTALEIAIPILREEGMLPIAKIPEVLALLTLMTAKGAMVIMFYMHLKGDRRMYGSLFVFPLIIVVVMFLGFIWLFQPTLW